MKVKMLDVPWLAPWSPRSGQSRSAQSGQRSLCVCDKPVVSNQVMQRVRRTIVRRSEWTLPWCKALQVTSGPITDRLYCLGVYNEPISCLDRHSRWKWASLNVEEIFLPWGCGCDRGIMRTWRKTHTLLREKTHTSL